MGKSPFVSTLCFIFVVGCFMFGIYLHIKRGIEFDDSRINCAEKCKPYRFLFCDFKYVVCDSTDGGKLIIFEE